MDPESETPQQIERVIKVDCSACGAPMTYDPTRQCLMCSHCNSTRELPKEADMVVEKPFSETIDLSEYPQGFGVKTKVFHCNSCGSETAVEPTTLSFECPFCNSKNVNEEAHDTRVVKPAGVMAFKIKKSEAVAKFKEWIKKGWFHPTSLKKLADLNKMQGVYLPFWTYDADTSSSWTAMAGYHYYVTESYTDSQGNRQTRQVQKTRWVPASGYYEHSFDDVLVIASQGVAQSMIEKIYPYELGEVVNYDSQYLLGWASEVYQKDVKQGYAIADKIMNDFIRSACASQVPGDTHRNLNVNTRKSGITFKHIMLPVWVAAYKFKNKVFQVVINGQTGKIGGDKPLSWLKITLAVLLAIGIGVGIYFLVEANK